MHWLRVMVTGVSSNLAMTTLLMRGSRSVLPWSFNSQSVVSGCSAPLYGKRAINRSTCTVVLLCHWRNVLGSQIGAELGETLIDVGHQVLPHPFLRWHFGLLHLLLDRLHKLVDF